MNGKEPTFESLSTEEKALVHWKSLMMVFFGEEHEGTPEEIVQKLRDETIKPHIIVFQLALIGALYIIDNRIAEFIPDGEVGDETIFAIDLLFDEAYPTEV